MRLFFDQLHVLVHPSSGETLLSVRVNDTRVDEYHFDTAVIIELAEAAANQPVDWAGPEALKVRFDIGKQMVGLSVAVGGKREVHRVGLSQFALMLAQFRSQVGRG